MTLKEILQKREALEVELKALEVAEKQLLEPIQVKIKALPAIEAWDFNEIIDGVNISVKNFASSRFDSAKFKKDNETEYSKYVKESYSTRITKKIIAEPKAK